MSTQLRGWQKAREWFWRGEALREARREHEARRHVFRFAERARIAAEVGEKTLDPPSAWSTGHASGLAASLFAESIGWSLRVADTKAGAAGPATARPATPAELEQLLASTGSLLGDAAGDSEAARRVTELLLERRFETDELHGREAEQAARELGRVARTLLSREWPTQARIDRLLFQRAWRLALACACLAGALAGWTLLRERFEARADLAAGKSWTASSSYEVVCASPAHHCAVEKSYFFHTLEESNPWLEIDLARASAFSKVRVVNRQDCCAERALPLVIEASNDHQHWKELARRTEPFDDFRAVFKPVSMRWVRIRAARRTILHLHDVRILP